jgi:hypothetical protein
MAGSKRTPLSRRRKPIFDDETLALFVELEATPTRLRKADDFKARDRELHRRLGLGGEWFCSVCSVLDRREAHHRPDSPQAADFNRMREARLALIKAATDRGYMIAGKPPSSSRDPRLNA